MNTIEQAIKRLGSFWRRAIERLRTFLGLVIERLRTFLGDVSAEFRRIDWPARREMVESTVVVIVFIVLLGVVVLVCDQAIQYLMKWIHA